MPHFTAHPPRVVNNVTSPNSETETEWHEVQNMIEEQETFRMAFEALWSGDNAETTQGSSMTRDTARSTILRAYAKGCFLNTEEDIEQCRLAAALLKSWRLSDGQTSIPFKTSLNSHGESQTRRQAQSRAAEISANAIKQGLLDIYTLIKTQSVSSNHPPPLGYPLVYPECTADRLFTRVERHHWQALEEMERLICPFKGQQESGAFEVERLIRTFGPQEEHRRDMRRLGELCLMYHTRYRTEAEFGDSVQTGGCSGVTLVPLASI